MKYASDKTKSELKILKEDAEKRITEVVTGKLSDMTYITNRIIIMSFPYSEENIPGFGKKRQNMICEYLEENHTGHYLIINISDQHYDTEIFKNNVVEYTFPGYSAPPLGLLFKICWNIESWLAADPLNVIVIHCMNGRGRSITVASCLLAWINLSPSAKYSLNYIAEKKNESASQLTVPTQRRYIDYFDKVLNGNKPSSHSIIIKKILIYNSPIEAIQSPEIKIYKDSIRIATLTSTEINHKCIIYETNRALQGNIMIRCTQILDDDIAITLFRCGFHTGFISNNKVVFHIEKLDGPLLDKTIKYNSLFLDFQLILLLNFNLMIIL